VVYVLGVGNFNLSLGINLPGGAHAVQANINDTTESRNTK
jgi:hypothetical protein